MNSVESDMQTELSLRKKEAKEAQLRIVSAATRLTALLESFDAAGIAWMVTVEDHLSYGQHYAASEDLRLLVNMVKMWDESCQNVHDCVVTIHNGLSVIGETNA